MRARLPSGRPPSGDTNVINALKILTTTAATTSSLICCQTSWTAVWPHACKSIQDGIYCLVPYDGYRGSEYLPDRPGTRLVKHRVYSASVPVKSMAYNQSNALEELKKYPSIQKSKSSVRGAWRYADSKAKSNLGRRVHEISQCASFQSWRRQTL